MPMHPPDCECDAYGCQLRRKGVAISRAATPNKPMKGKPGSNAEYNSWEKGKAGEQRSNGTFMPYLDGKGNSIPIKKFSENRATYDKRLKKVRSGGSES